MRIWDFKGPLQIVSGPIGHEKVHYEAPSAKKLKTEMINWLFDGFIGELTSSKWAKITKCSPDIALRDINDLIERKILKKEQSGGRSTHYSFLATLC